MSVEDVHGFDVPDLDSRMIIVRLVNNIYKSIFGILFVQVNFHFRVAEINLRVEEPPGLPEDNQDGECAYVEVSSHY